MKYQLIIKNAHYFANGDFFYGDILAAGGKIVGIVAAGTADYDQAERVIDAAGLEVLPGIVDSHVHFRDPSRPDREDFYTGSSAAAAGCVTTFCEMPLAIPPPCNVENLHNRIRLAEERSIVDFAMFGAAGYDNRYLLQDILDEGAIAFKTFLHPAPAGREKEFDGLTVNDDGQLYIMMQAAASTTGRYFFHCENAKLISAIEADLHEKGVNGNEFHYLSRAEVAETESVSTIIQFAKATGCKVGVVHISVPEACQMVKEAKMDGVDIVAETCFHYLTYDHSHIDEFGPYAKCNPPLRSAADKEKLWGYLLDGTITMVGSDHAPFTPEEKSIGLTQGIWKAYSGMPAIEMLLPIMLTHVNSGRITLAQLARYISENTAKLFHLYPQKGCIAVGSDADFAIIDMNEEYVTSIEKMYSKSKAINKLFDGTKVKGKPKYTVVRGTVVMENGVVDMSKKGYGQFARPQKAK
ncbi:MAG: amidohydrolase family protein [Firmicutes bacterium]|nr:amidohydrolase family protein [Bacillota bacterium]